MSIDPDEIALTKQVDQGAKAKEAFDNEQISNAFDILEEAYFQAWKASQPKETESRERLFTAVTIIGKVRSQLKQTIDDGKVAQAHLDEIASPGATEH